MADPGWTSPRIAELSLSPGNYTKPVMDAIRKGGFEKLRGSCDTPSFIKTGDILYGFIDITGFTQYMSDLSQEKPDEQKKGIHNTLSKFLTAVGSAIEGDSPEVDYGYLLKLAGDCISFSITEKEKFFKDFQKIATKLRSDFHFLYERKMGIRMALMHLDSAYEFTVSGGNYLEASIWSDRLNQLYKAIKYYAINHIYFCDTVREKIQLNHPCVAKVSERTCPCGIPDSVTDTALKNGLWQLPISIFELS